MVMRFCSQNRRIASLTWPLHVTPALSSFQTAEWSRSCFGLLDSLLHAASFGCLTRFAASGAYRDRTGDPQLAKLVLSQLS
jgi:hypothetical protein